MAYKRISPVPVVEGGTGLQTIASYSVLIGDGTSAISLVSPSTAGIPLVSAGASSNPAFNTALVVGGGTGAVTFTAYAPVLAGTTATGVFQSASTNFSSSGYVLTSTGSSSVPTWQALPSGSTLAITYVDHADSSYTVLTADQYLQVDSSGGVVSILLPNGPTTGRVIYIKDSTGSAATDNITITTVGGSVTIDGVTSYVLNTNYQSVNVIFDGTSYEVF